MNVQQLCDTIKSASEKISRTALPPISAIILLCSLAKRPGLSTIMSIINIAQSFAKKGIPTDNNPDGSPNLIMQVTYCIVDEVYRALREDASIQGAGGPGTLDILVNGTSPVGPVTATGTNTLPFSLNAIMR